MNEKLEYLLKKLDECLKCYKLKYFEKEDLKCALYPYIVQKLLIKFDSYKQIKQNFDNYIFACIKNRVNKELSKRNKENKIYGNLAENIYSDFNLVNYKKELMIEYLSDKMSPRNVVIFKMMLIKNMSFMHISELTNLSESRIRQIINSSIVILRRKGWYFD